jgi:RNA polymerase sigma factor (sigma-70 family)
MPQTRFGEVLRFLHRACATPAARDLTDGELLERFVADRDESAFASLVDRHGPMVLGVGRRLLGDSHEAEDIFQATFLILARRGGSIGGKKSVGGWLYGVAQHIALKARAQAAARRTRERKAMAMRNARPADDLSCPELRSALDEAIGTLPEKYRTPIVLCYLVGKSHSLPRRAAARSAPARADHPAPSPHWGWMPGADTAKPAASQHRPWSILLSSSTKIETRQALSLRCWRYSHIRGRHASQTNSTTLA